jgi:hypothetical protein
MMTCLEFRRRIGAEPFASEAELEAHRRECPACARHQDEMRAMDGLIRQALEVNPPPDPKAEAAPARLPRRRILAIAASLAVGVAVGLLIFVTAPRDAIAREVVGHVLHEPDTMDSTGPLPPGDLARVLGPDGLRLRPDAGDVTFASRCVFEGRVVPHLVVRTSEGPVTVLVLSHRSIARPLRFEEQGHAGVVLPAPRGAIAVVGQGADGLDAVAQKVFDALEWGA